MYAIEEVLRNIDARPTAISLAALMAMLVGYIQCIESIRLGFRDRTHAMPLIAVTYFFAHDTYFAGRYFSGYGVSDHWFFAAGGYVIAPYIILEIILSWQIIRYSGKEIGLGKTVPQVVLSYLAILVAMYVVHIYIETIMVDPLYLTTTNISLYMGTLWMIPLMLQRKSRKGQSILLALTLWIGQTLSMVIYFPMLADFFVSPIVIAMGVAHFILGAVYFVMVVKAPPYSPDLAHQPVD
jgi:hypothetical protein